MESAASEGQGNLVLRMKLAKFTLPSGAQVANTASESSQPRQHRPQYLFSVPPQQATGVLGFPVVLSPFLSKRVSHFVAAAGFPLDGERKGGLDGSHTGSE